MYIRHLADIVEFSMMSGNYTEINQSLNKTLQQENSIQGLILIAPDGTTVASTGNDVALEFARACWEKYSSCNSSETRFVYSAPFEISALFAADNPGLLSQEESRTPVDSNLGYAFLVIGSDSMEELQINLIATGVLIVLVSALLAVLVALSFSRGLSMPIQQLSRVVARIQDGDLKARTVPLATGELLELEVGVNAMAAQVEEADTHMRTRIGQTIQELSETLDNLEQRNTELVESREVAEEASRAKDMFLAKMSHELRTPLATVIGYSRLILLAENETQKIEYAFIMEQAADLLQVTIDDILDHARLQDDVVHLEEAEFNLLDCIESAVAMHVPAAHDKRVELISCCDDSLPTTVYGDSVRLAQIVTNLLSNAIKFTDEGHVILYAHAKKGEGNKSDISISVRDSGIGISAEKQALLFQPFVQADESINRNFGGSGLGLAIVSRLTDQMGGNVNLTSEVGKGTLVEINISLPTIITYLPPQQQDFLTHTDQIVGFDPIGEVGNIVCQNLELFGGEVQSYDYFEHFIKDIRLSNPVLVIASFRFDDEIRLGVESIRLVYQGPLLLLTSDSKVIDAWDNRWLSTKDKILKKPLKREYFRRVCRELILGVERPEVAVNREASTSRMFECSVLVVEDNQFNLRLLITQLEDHGVTVVAATNGLEALNKLSTSQLDLAFIDVHMPGMDGVVLAHRIRDLQPELPVYALTANVMGTEESDLYAAGVRKIFYKPITDNSLVEVLDMHQSRRESEPVSELMSELSNQLRIPDGMRAYEIVDELNSLSLEAKNLLGLGDLTELAAVCHKLHGVIKLFTEGNLIDMVKGLEAKAIAGEREAVSAILAELQIEFDLLESDAIANTPESPDSPMSGL
jgi:two-component system sensor histidine kinase BarA